MKRFNFPFNYTAKFDKINTLIYSSQLKKSICDYFVEKYKAMEVICPIVVDTYNSLGTNILNRRKITFDNKNYMRIYQISDYYDYYLMYLLSLPKFNKNFYTFYTCLNRDAIMDNLNSVQTQQLSLDFYSQLENHTVDYFVQLIKETYNDIVQLLKTNVLNNICRLNRVFLNPTYDVISCKKIEQKYLTMPFKPAFELFCSTRKLVILQDRLLDSHTRANNEWLFLSESKDVSVGLYTFHKPTRSNIELISITSRPSFKEAFDQLNKNDVLGYEAGKYHSSLISQQRRQMINIKINFSYLLLYLLEKVHLAEVVSSVWGEDFIKFCQLEKIDIM